MVKFADGVLLKRVLLSAFSCVDCWICYIRLDFVFNFIVAASDDDLFSSVDFWIWSTWLNFVFNFFVAVMDSE